MYDQAYKDIGKGLRMAFFGQLLAVLSSFTFISLGPILALTSLVLTLIGLSSAGRGDSGYRTAFSVTIVNLAVTAAASLVLAIAIYFIPSLSGVLAALLTIVSSLLGFLAVYYVCTTSSALLEDRETALSMRAATVWKLYGACIAITVVCGLTALLPFTATLVLAGGVSLLASIVQAVAGVLYMLFLYRASEVFQSW